MPVILGRRTCPRPDGPLLIALRLARPRAARVRHQATAPSRRRPERGQERARPDRPAARRRQVDDRRRPQGLPVRLPRRDRRARPRQAPPGSTAPPTTSPRSTTVDGAVSWPNASFRKQVTRALLKLSGNGLPTNHTTGTFPIAAERRRLRRRPQPEHDLRPERRAQPRRPPEAAEAGAVHDRRGRHRPQRRRASSTPSTPPARTRSPTRSRTPARATRSSRASTTTTAFRPASRSGTGKRHSKLIGWAYDGFPIYGPLGQKGAYMRTSDLDACHGHTHEISLPGRAAAAVPLPRHRGVPLHRRLLPGRPDLDRRRRRRRRRRRAAGGPRALVRELEVDEVERVGDAGVHGRRAFL